MGQSPRYYRHYGKEAIHLGSYQLYAIPVIDTNPRGYASGNIRYQWTADEPKYLTRHDYAEALRTTADVMEFFGPGLSNVPPEYVTTAAVLVGLAAGPEVALAVLAYYFAVAWGPYGLREAGDLIEPK